MSSSFRSAKKDDDDVESLVGTTKYAGGAPGLQKWDKAVLVDLGTGEQPWLKEVYMGELQTPTTDEEAKVTAKKIWQQRPLHEMMKRLTMPKGFKKLATQAGRRDWRHSWTAMSFSSSWLQRLSIAMGKEAAIATLRRTQVRSRQRVLASGESGDFESWTEGRSAAGFER